MKPQYTLLQKTISPKLTILFKEANPHHPDIISNGEGFSIIIEDWEKGTYRFVNSIQEKDKIINTHFTPNNIKPLKSVHDLNNLWSILTGNPLTYIGNFVEKVELGKIYLTNRCGTLKVIELIDKQKSKVKFDDGYTVIVGNAYIIKGTVRNPNTPLLFGVGYIGQGKYNSTNKEIYTRWKSILQRCYYENSRYIYKSYIDASICKEWECFQNFAKWYEETYNPETMQKWALDKDILFKGNKLYSPETCCFVPQEINNVFVKSEGVNSNNPTGVIKKRNKYFVCFFKGGKVFHSSGYNTKEEASSIYALEKDKYIKELAEKYKYVLDNNAYKALINYKTSFYSEE